jgi:signal transduction histidine kinase
MRERKEITGQELIIEREDGSRRNVICQPKLFFDESGNLVGALSMMNDITDWLETEKARLGLSGEDDFLASIPFSLRELLKEVMILMHAKAREKKISLELDYDNRLKHQFIGDVHRIKQILINLVSNAVKFTARGGVKIIVGHNSDNDYLSEVSIHVVDSGMGIAEHRKNAIFQSAGSSGLTRSQTLARLMGGEISLESREHSGSEFTLTLPLVIDNNLEPTENHQLSET